MSSAFSLWEIEFHWTQNNSQVTPPSSLGVLVTPGAAPGPLASWGCYGRRDLLAGPGALISNTQGPVQGLDLGSDLVVASHWLQDLMEDSL